jgi:type IV pilus assembly protein PilQ
MVLWNNAATRFLNLELSALESAGRGRVVSSPRILTANLVEAMIRQGDKINVRVSTDNETSVKEIDASLKLTVTPSITPDGNVQLSVNIMKDRADFSRVVDGIPAIESREAKSEVLVENGGTVVIGGVFEEDEISSETQVPFLGDIPVVGNLFKSQARRGERRELLIFITPRIVSDALTLR